MLAILWIIQIIIGVIPNLLRRPTGQQNRRRIPMDNKTTSDQFKEAVNAANYFRYSSDKLPTIFVILGEVMTKSMYDSMFFKMLADK